jgi:hypothetical protein
MGPRLGPKREALRVAPSLTRTGVATFRVDGIGFLRGAVIDSIDLESHAQFRGGTAATAITTQTRCDYTKQSRPRPHRLGIRIPRRLPGVPLPGAMRPPGTASRGRGHGSSTLQPVSPRQASYGLGLVSCRHCRGQWKHYDPDAQAQAPHTASGSVTPHPAAAARIGPIRAYMLQQPACCLLLPVSMLLLPARGMLLPVTDV